MNSDLKRFSSAEKCSCYTHHLNPTTHLIHSEGFREACDYVIDFNANYITPHRLGNSKDQFLKIAEQLPIASTIHVKSDHLSFFFREAIPKIKHPIILVSGDSDYGGVADHLSFIDHPNIIHWFAQNCELQTKHPKITPIPIGIDNPIFTKLDKRLGHIILNIKDFKPFRNYNINERGFQPLLNEISKNQTLFVDKPMSVLATFHQFERLKKPNLNESGREPRKLAFEQLEENSSVYFVKSRIPQTECWKMHNNFSFEISPLGKGLDSHRTWEALCLNTIPIVVKSPLDYLYQSEDLPVIILDSWLDITPENLSEWKSQYSDSINGQLQSKLTMTYWENKINSVKNFWKSANH